MTSKPTLSLFPTRNAEGARLRELLLPIAEELGFTHYEDAGEATPVAYLRACAEADIVVLDASIAPRGEHNYSFATPQALDHVLVVSRTYRPLNFYGLRGSPDPTTRELLYGTPSYPDAQSNEAIARWVRIELENLRPRLPRPKSGLLRTVLRDLPKGWDAQDTRRRESGQIFVTYRRDDSESVEALRRRIENGAFPGVPPSPVRYFPPGMLSDELSTEQRRWQIVSAIDRFMSPARELWLFASGEYYNSWWTLGEILTLAYRREVGYRGKQPPRLRILEPDTERLRDAPADFLPRLSKAQQKRVARWFANADTAGMGPEGIAAIRLMAELPLLGRLGYFRDHVWSDEFWRYPILDCPGCRVLGHCRNRFDVDEVLWTRGDNFTRITPEQMRICVEQRRIACPRCGAAYDIFQGAPQYLWMPIVNGHVTARYWMTIFGVAPEDPEELFLVPLPTYRLQRKD